MEFRANLRQSLRERLPEKWFQVAFGVRARYKENDFRLLHAGFVSLFIRRLSAHRIPQRRHMLARPAIRTIAAPVLNVQITIQLQPYRIVFRTAHLCPITPGGSFLDVANLALLKIQQSAFGDMGREQVERVDTGHGWFPRSC